jgi:hypothetical protein
MRYTSIIHPNVMRQIRQWGLSDFLLVEVYLSLREELAADPVRHLHRDPDGSDSFYVFEKIDPDSMLWVHIFMFRVYYREDEQHLDIVRGSDWRMPR